MQAACSPKDDIIASKGLVKKYWGEGWAEAFENVVIRKHMTHSFHLTQNWATRPPLNEGWKSHDPPLIKHDILVA